MVQYVLPKLSYSYDDLEPYIDAKTMQIHHEKHHQTYVDGLNKALQSISGQDHPKHISSILHELHSLPESAQNAIDFFGGGFENHRLFWENMSPDGGGKPGGKIGSAISVYFESFENFQKIFLQNALSIEGSGWTWLVFNETYSRIEIINTNNQTSPWTVNKIPILGLDVWEHAYYLKYQNKRNEYVSSWWNVVNWDVLDKRYSEVSD